MTTLANTLLFIASILILLDLSPRDVLPKAKRRKRAIMALRKARIILRTPDRGVTIRPESSSMSMEVDDESFLTLKELIYTHSEYSGEVDWSQVVGIGYSTLSVPVGKFSLPAIRPLYVSVNPEPGSSSLSLIRVGLLDDLDHWVTSWRKGLLTWTAAGFLSLAYLIQLVANGMTPCG